MASKKRPSHQLDSLDSQIPGPVIGLDEAGRGCLAGPVAIGFVIFPLSILHEVPDDLKGIRDSKKLSPARRQAYVRPIQSHSVCSGVLMPSSRTIDRLGINPTIEEAMIGAVHRCIRSEVIPRSVLVDGNYPLRRMRALFPDLDIRCIVGGDDRILSIASASILAKVFRDRRMVRYDSYYPGYDFTSHAGYGTSHHRSRLMELGRSPIHRTSYNFSPP
ncbi:MAG: ribonuclease HII [Leptospiraceae bacterium]|nr:ribonuclease HII [Leptospiraceae bacterium]